MVKQVCSNCCSFRVTETTLPSSDSSVRTCICTIETWYKSNESIIYDLIPKIHTCTIGYCQKKHSNIQQHIIVLLHSYKPVLYEIVRTNTNISSSILLSSIYTYLYTMILSDETLRYPAVYYCPPLIHTSTI